MSTQPIKQSYLERVSAERGKQSGSNWVLNLDREVVHLRSELTKIRDLCQQACLTFEDQAFAATQIAQEALATSATPDQTSIVEADLRASLAAIHYNASRPNDCDTISLTSQMESIVEECERCIPALKELRP